MIDRVLILIAMLIGAGCAGNGPAATPPHAVDGLCGIDRGTCRIGSPVGAGGTSPPYEWSCSGQYGGTPAPCSVPHAETAEGEVFAGKNALEERLKAAGPLRGFLRIEDPTLSHPNCEPIWCHYHSMKRAAVDMGIPEENISMPPDDYHSDPAFRAQVRVAAYPTAVLFERDWFPGIGESWHIGILHVAAAGNTAQDAIDRRLWYPDNQHWVENAEWRWWDTAMDSFATGRVIMAKYVVQKPDGTVEPLEQNVKCGIVGEYCYSVIHDPYDSALGDLEPVAETSRVGTSSASVRLASLAFYLSQLWETPQEIVHVLNVCAEDAGEPGIDEEYGRGVVAVVCDTVQQRERTAVGDSVRTSYVGSPVLDQMVRAAPQSERFRPFHAVRGWSLRTMTGYAGGSFAVHGTRLFVSGGAEYRPFGVRSSMLHDRRTPFGEIGARRRLFTNGDHGIDAAGSYGYSRAGSLSLAVARTGVRYAVHRGDGSLSVYSGLRLAYGALGIPGYQFAGARPVAFAEALPESRIDFRLEW